MSDKNSLKVFSGETERLICLSSEITDCHHSTPKWTDYGKIVIRNFNIKNGSLSLEKPSYTDDKTFNDRIARSVPEAGDLIITREAPMGQVCKIPDGLECCLGQRMVLIKPNKHRISSDYLLYALQSEFVQKQINQNDRTGSIVSNLRIPVLKDLLIPMFDSVKRQWVAKILSAIDAKIELNNQINKKLEGMAKLIYDYWFVQFDFPISKEQAIAMGDPSLEGIPYKSSGGKMVYNEQLKREIPEGWGCEIISELLDESKGLKKIPTSQYLKEGKYPIVDQSRDFICGFTDDKNSVINGSNEAKIIFGDHTRILKLINFDFARGADGTQVISSNPERLPLHFFYHTLLKIDLSNYGYARHFKFLKAINILVPNSVLSTEFDKIVSEFYIKKRENIRQNQKLSELRDWLLPMLMNGQVSPTREASVTEQ
ncbi:MAG: restriction endonuclease subunit S [Bacteroidota bacterium]